MRHVMNGYHGLSALVGYHRDQMVATTVIAGAVLAAAWLQSL